MKFVSSTASYRTWVEEYLEGANKRGLALQALDSFDRIENATNICAEELVPIINAARCPFVRVWEIGVDLLNRLAVSHQPARDAIYNMISDRKAAVRYQAIACLGLSDLPSAFAD